MRSQLLLTALAWTLAASSAPAEGLDGKWDFDLDTPTGSRKAPVEFHVDGDRVSGKWGKFDAKGIYKDGLADLAFPYTSEEGLEGSLKIQGKLEGEAFVGTWVFNEYKGTLRATRAAVAPAGDVAGKWKFSMDTAGGQRDIDADLNVEGGQISGRWGNADAKGTFQDGQLNMSFALTSAEAGAGTFKATGRLEKGVLTGAWEFNEHNGTFKATRP